MSVYASRNARRFFPSRGLATDLPVDAVEVSDDLYLTLLEGQAKGGVINFDDSPPTLIDASPSIDQRRIVARARINAMRDRAIYGGFVFAGHTFQSDERSRRRLDGAADKITASAATGNDYVWRTVDNKNVELTPQEVLRFAIAMQNQETAIIVTSRELKDRIATSIEPEAITWDGAPMPTSMPQVDESTLGDPVVDVPAAAELAVTAVQPSQIPKLPTLATVATTGKYSDLTGKPAAIDIPKTIQLPVQVNAQAVGSVTVTGFATKPQAVGITTVVGTTLAPVAMFPMVTSIVAGSVAGSWVISVTAYRTKGTLLLTAGPVELAPSITVNIEVKTGQ